MKGPHAIVSDVDQPLSVHIDRYRSVFAARRFAKDLTLRRRRSTPCVARLSTPPDDPEVSAHPL